MNVGSLLRANARRLKKKPCLVFEGREVSYEDMDLVTDRLGMALLELGLARGKKIALYFQNSVEWVELYFAASKAGITVVPLSFRAHGEELAYLINHSQPDALAFDHITGPRVEEVKDKLAVKPLFICTGGMCPGWAQDYGELLHHIPKGQVSTAAGAGLKDIHSICYTSGTTGRPKGVLLTNANLVVGQYFNSLTVFPFTEKDVFVITTPLCHRTGWGRLVQAVGLGSTACLLGTPFKPEVLVKVLADYRATVAGMVPTMARMLLEEVPSGDLRRLDRWRALLLTGESCPMDLKEKLRERVPSVMLYSFYASTETGMVSCLYGEDQLLRPKSVGRPVPGIEVCIKDNQESGELLIRSGLPGEHTVMLGYYKDPQATAAALVDGWFHTGDAGYFDEDGYLYISDRVKDMVITGGLNVASREVEEVLLKHPGVKDAAVIGVPDPLWGEAVKAFVVAKNGVSAGELQKFCAERLSGYKKPKYVQFVEDLPRSPTGKVLKHVLRNM